jgi:hypothetical protein
MRRQQLRRAALIAAVLTGSAGSAMAQETPSEFALWRTPGWSFTPGVTIGPLWDSNVALASTASADAPAEGDSLLVVEPTVQVRYVSNRTEVNGGYLGYVRRYKDLDELNGVDHRGYFSLRRVASRRLSYSLTNEYGKLPTTDLLMLNGVPFTRNGTQMNALTGKLDARLSKLTAISVGYENTWVKFERRDALSAGGRVNGLESEVSRRLNQGFAVGAEYAVRFADVNDGTRQLTFQETGGAVHAQHGSRTTFTLAGGLSHLADRTLNTTHTGPYVRADVTHETGRATLGASFERTFAPSFGIGASNRNEEVRGSIRMPLDRNRMYVQGTASWRRSEPFDDLAALNLDTILVRSTVGYGVARWLRLEGFYAFSRQDTRIAGGGIDRHSVGTQIVVSQPMRIH